MNKALLVAILLTDTPTHLSMHPSLPSLTLPVASVLNVLRLALPYYLDLTKYDLLHLDATTFEFRPHPPARRLPRRCLLLRVPAVALIRDGEPSLAHQSPIAASSTTSGALRAFSWARNPSCVHSRAIPAAAWNSHWSPGLSVQRERDQAGDFFHFLHPSCTGQVRKKVAWPRGRKPAYFLIFIYLL